MSLHQTSHRAAFSPARAPEARPGFSLIELLTVILIIAIVIAILVPVLGGARNVARAQSTRGLMQNLLTASQAFKNDRQRLPGLFSPEQMGAPANGTVGNDTASAAGLSAAENVMLDLAGGEAVSTAATAPNAAFLPVTPLQANGNDPATRVWVNPGLIGADKSGYFAPSGEFFVAQTSAQNGDPGTGAAVSFECKQYGNLDQASVGQSGDPQIPDLVDAFGQPLLLWVANTELAGTLSGPDLGNANGTGSSNFANTDNNTNRPHLFYWNANAAFLRANSFGEKGANLRVDPTTTGSRGGSIIGHGALASLGTEGMGTMLMALLGSPSFPADLNDPAVQSNYYENSWPTRARGEFIVHSAGADGIPFSSADAGIRGQLNTNAAARDGNASSLRYGLSFSLSTNRTARRLDDTGRPATQDIAELFDDLLVNE